MLTELGPRTRAMSDSDFITVNAKMLWVHQHSTITKVVAVGSLFLSVGLLGSLPLLLPLAGIPVTVVLGIVGALAAFVSSTVLLACTWIFPPHHDMKQHVYKPGQYAGSKLYYKGDVPVLALNSDKPRESGQAHGYLCGEGIHRVVKRFSFALYTLGREPQASQLAKTLERIRKTIPSSYLEEMEGLIQGYRQWAKEQPFWKRPIKLTTDQLLLLHLMPDSLHFSTAAAADAERKTATAAQRQQIVACTAIVDEDRAGNLVFGRNMDWSCLGIAGTYSLVIHRKYTRGPSTQEVGLPGFVGVVTGMNDRGLSLAMNVCEGTTHEIRGMPAALYNRMCLETCPDVQAVRRFIANHSPLGPYHLTVADPQEAQSIHFYQGSAGTPRVRQWKKGEPLCTFNFSFSPEAAEHKIASDTGRSYTRQRVTDKFLLTRRREEPIEQILSLLPVNNPMTTHSVVMKPRTREFEVAFNNGFAGKDPRHKVEILAEAG